jgi:glycosyltransferase involved in cell wall biosynthesis
MKKVLIITYYWPPSGGAGVQRWLKFVKYFSEFGIDAIVITVDENKASYQLKDETLQHDIPANIKVIRTNTFEPFELYKKLTNKKEIPHSGFANEPNPSMLQNIMRFIRGNFFIPDPRKGWNKYAYEAAAEIISKEKIDAVITTSPPHSTQLIGLKIKGKFNIPWIADLRDPWTDIYFYNKLFHTTLAKKIDAAFERKVLETADSIMVVSQDIKRIFASKSVNIIADKISVIPNGFDEEDFNQQVETNADEFSITYTGSITETYNIDAFLTAFKSITVKYSQAQIRLKFIGNISENIISKFENLKLQQYLSVEKYVPHKESVAALMKSDIVLLVIPQIDKNEGILTGKLFEYIGSEKPILCIGPPHGDAAVIIEECRAGKTFDYSNTDAIAAFIEQQLLKHKNINTESLTNNNTKKYSRKNLTNEVAEIIKKLAN